jgi:hypothetical protein
MQIPAFLAVFVFSAVKKSSLREDGLAAVIDCHYKEKKFGHKESQKAQRF